MGNRANVKVEMHDGNSVYLYTHWGGDGLPFIVQRVLAKRLRWKDEPYLTRMIFSEMIRGDIEGETGYGIATYACDNEHSIIVVACENQTISFVESDGKNKNKLIKHWSFDGYIEATEEEIKKHYK